MGCACKAIKKQKKEIELAKFKEKKGVSYFLYFLKEGLFSIINKLFVCCLFIILTPILIIFLIFSYLFGGKLRVIVPKSMINVLKRVFNNE